MKKMNIEEIKLCQLEILDSIAEYCANNSIKWYLAYGTLLGAVRHQGYIPWDDDVDIYMFRPDYEKFNEGFNGIYQDYSAHNIYTDCTYRFPYTKVFDDRTVVHYPHFVGDDLAVDIDVFPIDSVPDEDVLKKMIRRRNKWGVLDSYRNNVSYSQLTPVKKVIKLILSLFPHDYFLRHLDFTAKRYSEKTEYPYVVGLVGGDDFLLPRSAFEKTLYVEFENRKYPIPSGFDQILTQTYGDYMLPPPEHKRATVHSNDAYWK